MDIVSYTAQQLIDQAQRLSAITSLTKSSPRDRFLLVMGKTGSGKSSFVARCTGKDVTVGHGLYSCTSSIDTYSYTLPRQNRRIHLIDTPGFNHTNRSNIETFSILASYLGASYANSISIHGIVVLHLIRDNRMSGSSMRNIEMMKKMYGWCLYENLVIIMIDVNEETLSARRIVSHLLAESDASTPPPLRLQREIIDQGKTLDETGVGMAIASDLYKARKEHEKQLRDLELKLKGRLAKSDASHAAELEDLRAYIHRKLSKAEKEKIQRLDKSLREHLAQKEEELEELEESIREIHEEAMSSKWSFQAEKEYEEHQSILNTARQEVGQVRDVQEKLKAQTGNITDGLPNGIAAGIVTGAMSGALL